MFRMNVYNCVSTDNRVGLIEVVLQAETIANIQKGKGMFSVSSAFRKGSIFGKDVIVIFEGDELKSYFACRLVERL